MDNLYKYISTATTTTITDRPCLLHSITVNTTAAGAITVYDGATQVAAVLKSGVAEGTYTYNIVLRRYLKVVTAAASDITVAYRPTAA